MTDLEECLGGSGVERAVLDDRLPGEVLGGRDGHVHALDGEERGQVGRVRRHDDEREEPPHAAYRPPGRRPARTSPVRSSTAAL